MKRETFLGFRRLLLGFTALSFCSGLEVSIPQRQYEVARGADIAMTCSYVPARPDFKNFILKWEAQPEKDNDPWRPVASYFLNSLTNIAPDYEGRAVMTMDLVTQQSTLQLNQVLMQDNRTFQCSVTIENDDEGVTAATTSLLVIVAPSKPVCGIQGTAEYWNNISLTCVSAEGSPTPTYAWKSYSVQNVPRPNFPPHTTEKDGTLSLVNISMETSGFFICTSANRIASENCNLTLSVLPISRKIGATVGIIGGVLAGIVILGIIIYCCCCRKEKQDKHDQGSPEAVEFEDRPSVRDQYWDDKSSSLTKPYIEESDHFEEKSVRDEGNYSGNQVGKSVLDSDQHSYEDKDGQESSYDNKRDNSRGSRDRLDDQSGRYHASRDRLDDRHDDVRGSRDPLDDQRDRYRGSRDRLDDRHDDVRGSRDRLDDQRDRYRGSRDHLDDHHDDVRGSRDRLDDNRDRNGSRERLDDNRDRRYGSREHLDDNRERRYGSREHLDDNRERRYGSREHLDAE